MMGAWKPFIREHFTNALVSLQENKNSSQSMKALLNGKSSDLNFSDVCLVLGKSFSLMPDGSVALLER
jgi:hypothetical protein